MMLLKLNGIGAVVFYYERRFWIHLPSYGLIRSIVNMQRISTGTKAPIILGRKVVIISHNQVKIWHKMVFH
jgi:hypothetical protein